MPSDHQILKVIMCVGATAALIASYFLTWIMGWGKGWSEAADTSIHHPDCSAWQDAIKMAKDGLL